MQRLSNFGEIQYTILTPDKVLNIWCMEYSSDRVPTGQGKLEKVREFDWSGKVRENAKVTGKSGKFGGKFYLFCTVVVMLIVVELETNPPYC